MEAPVSLLESLEDLLVSASAPKLIFLLQSQHPNYRAPISRHDDEKVHKIKVKSEGKREGENKNRYIMCVCMCVSNN